jgi:hypothetical protein
MACRLRSDPTGWTTLRSDPTGWTTAGAGAVPLSGPAPSASAAEPGPQATAPEGKLTQSQNPKDATMDNPQETFKGLLRDYMPYIPVGQ